MKKNPKKTTTTWPAKKGGKKITARKKAGVSNRGGQKKERTKSRFGVQNVAKTSAGKVTGSRRKGMVRQDKGTYTGSKQKKPKHGAQASTPPKWPAGFPKKERGKS